MLVWALGELRFGESVPVLLGFLESQDIELRKRVLLALGGIKSPETVEPMIKVATTDPSGTVRSYAIDALAGIPDDRTIQPLIDLMGQWPVTLAEEPVEELSAWGRGADGTPFHTTTRHDPRACYQTYMVPNVIVPALKRLTNHRFEDHAAWVVWWKQEKDKGLAAAYVAGFTGYRVELTQEGVPVLIRILEDEKMPRYKRENAQRCLSLMLDWPHWDMGDFRPRKWAADWRQLLAERARSQRPRD